MKLSAALEYFDDVEQMPQRWGAVVLVRNRREKADSPKAYDMLPVVAIRADDGGRAVEVVTADPQSTRRARELKAGEAVARLKALAKTHASARLFAAHSGQDHVRIYGIAADPDLDALLFLQWFKGIEREL